FSRDWSSDVCSSDLTPAAQLQLTDGQFRSGEIEGRQSGRINSLEHIDLFLDLTRFAHLAWRQAQVFQRHIPGRACSIRQRQTACEARIAGEDSPGFAVVTHLDIDVLEILTGNDEMTEVHVDQAQVVLHALAATALQ